MIVLEKALKEFPARNVKQDARAVSAAKGGNMVLLETFTGRAPDSSPGRDTVIELCPRCGRPGVERRTAEGRSCVHSETSELLADGLLTVPVESCPLGPLPFDVRDRDVI
jgi:hypothetical protein